MLFCNPSCLHVHVPEWLLTGHVHCSVTGNPMPKNASAGCLAYIPESLAYIPAPVPCWTVHQPVTNVNCAGFAEKGQMSNKCTNMPRAQ